MKLLQKPRSLWRVLFAMGSLIHLVVPAYSACQISVFPTGEISVDGEIEPAWDGSSREVIGNYLQGDSCLQNDFSGSVRALWDSAGKKLYLLVEVQDDLIVRDSGGNSWEDDNIEIYLDGNASRGTTYDGENDYQFRFLPAPSNGELLVSGAPYTGGLTYAFAQTNDGYRLEVGLDLGQLGVEVNTGAATGLGFDIHLCDDDNGGGRDHKLAWCALIDNSWFNPSIFGTLVLEPEQQTTAYAVSIQVEGEGSVSIEPDKTGYYPGQMIELQAIPEGGHRFAGWTGTFESNDSPLTFSVQEDVSLTALFELIPAGAAVFAMNCGGGSLRLQDDILYQPNNYSNPRSSAQISVRDIAQTDDDDLYHSWQKASTKLIYAIPLPPGLYEVDLMWAAPPWQNAQNRTVMDVSLNGRLVEDDLDVLTVAGGADTALVRTYPVLAAGGELRLVLFRGISGEPYINGVRIRSALSTDTNQPPLLRIVDKPGVTGGSISFCSCDFETAFFDADGDDLNSIRIEATPVHGQLSLEGETVQAGTVLSRENLENLRYESFLDAQGRDHFQWRGFDGSDWSEKAAAVHVFMRARENAVENLTRASWNTFQWPLFAYYPEGPQNTFGVVLGGDGVWRYGNACGPTARSHVNVFWEYPRQPVGSIQFTDNDGSLHDPGYPERVYRYGLMPAYLGPNEPESRYSEVATLMFDNEELAIDVWANGANTWEPMIPYHEFDGAARLINRDEVGEQAWVAALKHELNMGRLVQITGQKASGGGHWWLVTGYNEQDQFYSRLNYGPEGFYPNGNFDGYCCNLTIMTNLQPAKLGMVLLQSPAGRPLEPSLPTGSELVIRWSAPNATTVDVEYTMNGGQSWTPVAQDIQAEPGSLSWTTPADETNAFMVRVTDGEDLNSYDQSGMIVLETPLPRHTVVFEQSEHGTIQAEPEAADYEKGTRVTVNAVPNAGYRFAGWEGLAQGNANPLAFNINENGTIRANFSRVIDDQFTEWIDEKNVPSNKAGWLDDPDLDGLNNFIEFLLAEGNPELPAKLPILRAIAGAVPALEMRTRPGLDLTTVQVQYCHNLSAGTWLPAGDPSPVQVNKGADRVTLTWDSPQNSLYFRFILAD